MGNRKLLISLDVDSPIKLLDFYRIKNVNYSLEELEKFYQVSFERALDFFDRKNLKITFFVVGDELEKSDAIKKIILNAHASGHEIENHTYSHPFGLAHLSKEKIIEEASKCSEIIEQVIGEKPIGFRSPGYNVNTKLINILDDMGFRYDSSGFWSVMNPILKATHRMLFKNGVNNADFGLVSSKLKQIPYSPSKEDWITPSMHPRNIIELPFPSTPLFRLPYYHNFNLWVPNLYSNYISKIIRRPYIMYLFHIIEFMDLTDNIPACLKIHPNVKTLVSEKLKVTEKILDNMLHNYEFIKTRSFVENYVKTNKY